MPSITSTNSTFQANQVIEFINKNKRKANYIANGLSAGVNFLTFLNGNTSFMDSMKENLELASTVTTRIATVTSGLINTDSAIKGRNIFAAAGGIAELPIAFFSSGYNLWLFRGLAIGLNNFQAIFSKLNQRDKDGNRGTDNPIDSEFKNLDFANGTWKGLKLMIKEFPHILHDLIKKPKEVLKSSPHIIAYAASTQITGTIIALLGLTKIGAGLRNLGGALVDIGFVLDNKKQKNGEKKSINDSESYFLSGAIWLSAAVIDFLKRFEFFENLITNHTELSLVFDRGAMALFTNTNQNLADKGK